MLLCVPPRPVSCRRRNRGFGGDRSIDIVRPPGEVYDQEGEAIWLGSRLRTNCTFADLVWLWNALRARHPAVWLINNIGRMSTPQAFLEECGLPALCRATTDEDTTSHDLADESFSEYAALARTTRRHDARWREASAHMSVSAIWVGLGWSNPRLRPRIGSRRSGASCA